ncbi:LysE family translocator [Luedemannella flava]|uniref:LysE family translocator n=1 Tax=Luedemannella flava TaxID=349316 RepID=UPI0031D70EBD
MIEPMLAFALVAAVVTVTPGLDTVLVLRTAAVSGRRAALAAGAGINMGCFVWAVASGLSITAVLTASRLAYDGLRWAGAAYLCWLGFRALWTSRRAGTVAEVGPVPAQRAVVAFRTGLATNLLNPKVGVFYLSILPQFLPENASPVLASVTMALIHNLEGLAWFALLVLVVRGAGGLINRPTVRRRLDQIVGVCFIGFGLRLAAEGARR